MNVSMFFRWRMIKGLQTAVWAKPVHQNRPRSLLRSSPRRRIVPPPSPQQKTLSKTRQTSSKRTAKPRPLRDYKHTLCTEFIFLCSLCTNLRYVEIKRRTMDRFGYIYDIDCLRDLYTHTRSIAYIKGVVFFWQCLPKVSHANCLSDYFLILMYYMYIFALTLLIEMFLNMLYICKFEKVRFCQYLAFWNRWSSE